MNRFFSAVLTLNMTITSKRRSSLRSKSRSACIYRLNSIPPLPDCESSQTKRSHPRVRHGLCINQSSVRVGSMTRTFTALTIFDPPPAGFVLALNSKWSSRESSNGERKARTSCRLTATSQLRIRYVTRQTPVTSFHVLWRHAQATKAH